MTYNARGLLRDVTPSVFSNTSWKYDHTDTAVWVRSYSAAFPPSDTRSDLVTPAFEAQYNSGLSTKHLFFAGRRFVSIDSTGSIRYYHPDERGSVRYITDAQGNVPESHLYKLDLTVGIQQCQGPGSAQGPAAGIDLQGDDGEQAVRGAAIARDQAHATWLQAGSRPLPPSTALRQRRSRPRRFRPG